MNGYTPLQPLDVNAIAQEISREGTNISAEQDKEIAAFRRLLETPDFACVRKDRGGNFHVRMHRDGVTQSFVAPTLDEAATLALWP